MHISGVRVHFPEGRTPFPQQIGVMQKIITSIEHSGNALLESPTGTGKTLAILCAALSWQKRRFDAECEAYMAEVKKPRPSDECGPALPRRIKVFYSSRTHTQLSQVTVELKRCPPALTDGLSVCVLASREQYCVHPTVSASSNKNDACAAAVADSKCVYYTAAHFLTRQIKSNIMDIEDLVIKGKKELSCPFHASKRAMPDADLVFLPYSYLIDPSIRSSSGVGDQIAGGIVIFDEAHNVEDVSRDAASVEISVAALATMAMQLDLVGSRNSGSRGACDTLATFCRALSVWARDLLDVDVVLEGEAAVVSMQAGGIYMTREYITGLFTSSNALRSVEDATVLQLNSLMWCMRYLEDNKDDYRVAKTVKGGGPHLCVWCMSPAVAFKTLAKTTRTLVLTSGTLSPLSTFAGELGVEFAQTLEASHVCNTSTQLISLAIQKVGNEPLDCTFRNASRPEFQNAVGQAIKLVVGATPGGTLVFFPSYTMLERCCILWKSSGLWKEMEQGKKISMETKGGSDKFDKAIAQYRTHCRTKGGAVFFAVFRGKLSEGIDFRDEQARAVVIIGIPFPNTMDLVVGLKKKYQDQRKKALTGDQWYRQQAYRALNQALGRVIRHKDDYGAIILLDRRFGDSDVVKNLSKWMRGTVRKQDQLQQDQITDFFKLKAGI